MRFALLAFLLASGFASAASFECRRNDSRVEQLICADAVVSDLDEVMARFGQLVYDDRQGAFVIRQPGGRQYIVLLDIMRHGDNATLLPVLEETNRGATLTARGYLSPREPATPQFDRRHCVYLYRAP